MCWSLSSRQIKNVDLCSVFLCCTIYQCSAEIIWVLKCVTVTWICLCLTNLRNHFLAWIEALTEDLLFSTAWRRQIWECDPWTRSPRCTRSQFLCSDQPSSTASWRWTSWGVWRWQGRSSGWTSGWDPFWEQLHGEMMICRWSWIQGEYWPEKESIVSIIYRVLFVFL